MRWVRIGGMLSLCAFLSLAGCEDASLESGGAPWSDEGDAGPDAQAPRPEPAPTDAALPEPTWDMNPEWGWDGGLPTLPDAEIDRTDEDDAGAPIVPTFDAQPDEPDDPTDDLDAAVAEEADEGVAPPGPDAAPPEPDAEPAWACTAPTCDSLASSTNVGRMQAINACAFEMSLEKPIAQGEALADRLIERLRNENVGKRVTMAEVLSHLNRQARWGLTAASKSRLSGRDPVGFRWNTGDTDTAMWYPQGVTGSSDAAGDHRVEGRRLLLASWYHKTDDRPTRGARVTLVDLTNTSDVNYRHLLLVDPYESGGQVNYREAAYDGGNALHAGGIVWYGRYLYVADTSKGVRIYDLSRIFQPSKTDDTARLGISAGRSDAHGYRYAVPRIARYKLTRDTCPLRFSFVGLDRQSSPPVLVNGEYFVDHQNGQLALWPLDAQTHLLQTRRGIAKPSEAALIGQTRAQGAVRIGDQIYVSTSSQDGTRYGRLYANKPGQQSRSMQSLYGIEDIYYERDKQLLWGQTEHPGQREVFAVPRAKLP